VLSGDLGDGLLPGGEAPLGGRRGGCAGTEPPRGTPSTLALIELSLRGGSQVAVHVAEAMGATC
jgi:hypothetical protein